MLVISDTDLYLKVVKKLEARSWFEVGIEHFKNLNNQFEKEQDTIIKEIIFIL